MTKNPPASRRAGRRTGFTLTELMIAVAIVGILAAIAYPSYINSITKSKRRAAQACLSSYATYMERFYTTNLRYDIVTVGPSAGEDIVLPVLECATAQNTGADYAYGFATGSPTSTTYTLQATPTGVQAARDAACNVLTLTHTGTRGVSGATSSAADCW